MTMSFSSFLVSWIDSDILVTCDVDNLVPTKGMGGRKLKIN